MLIKNTIDDGFNIELVETAEFTGMLEFPVIEAPKEIIIPKGLIPFSERNKSKDSKEFVAFYEPDIKFADILKNPQSYIYDLARFEGIVSTDYSLYTDSPLTAQIANTYRNRVLAHYFQQKGFYVIPNVRFGDERSYTTKCLREKFAFLGLPKRSILSIGTYGCSQTQEEKKHLKNGIREMIKELEPQVVLVYGAMNEKIFGDFKDKTRFINYPDFITLKHKKTDNNKEN